MPQIGVIGAGISGLTATYRLRQRDASVRLLEATNRAGGVIRTKQQDGFLVEMGPNSIQSNALLNQLLEDLGLENERVPANDVSSRRYAVRDGKPVPIPSSIRSFLTSNLFSTWAKLRLLAEPFIPKRSDEARTESLANFVRRRLGSEALDYAVSPFVGGVYAADPECLSTRHTFEKLHQWEQQYGSLIWGAVRTAADHSSDTTSLSGPFSFRNGLETLPRRLARIVEDSIHYKAPVIGIHRQESSWRVDTDPAAGPPHSHQFDGIICTVPLHQLPQVTLDSPVDCSPLTDVPYPPIRIVALGYDQRAVEHPLDGFGVLVPPVEPYDILGTLFSSTLFPNRAPDDHVLLTTFVGGNRQPHLAEKGPPEVQRIVERDLGRLLGVQGDPGFAKHVYWPRAIPQYTLNHGAVKNTLNAIEQSHSGLFFAGNYRNGVSVGDAMASGASAADRCLDSLTP